MAEQKQVTVEQVVKQRLGAEIGALKSRLIEVETFNQILVQQNEELQAKVQELEGVETDKEGE